MRYPHHSPPRPGVGAEMSHVDAQVGHRCMPTGEAPPEDRTTPSDDLDTQIVRQGSQGGLAEPPAAPDELTALEPPEPFRIHRQVPVLEVAASPIAAAARPGSPSWLWYPETTA